ncbi:neutral/alkaline non-lysosomal ceramidase N-terminal domain-containing protein [Parapedobacter indicus]|uniref:Neutral/alkaline non-lysosomal ceramidase, N-terminal n=1 Tax=Parapedobacter indicus TaxID=1477437 RepID=A0A1I3FVI4_9SPHI|nr:neutral/alkaline non-lysosomal ceramidase N-terminal domain-containing protein [Parapedobacter indicus]PPL03909.1 neutral/alkaline ceramidase-like enzyme [Parapedobacter indicus]SFI15263.1 Neutral/alkaline non-lysosomal ceramidase, N-terminal [Parapedobacter indicus]
MKAITRFIEVRKISILVGFLCLSGLQTRGQSNADPTKQLVFRAGASISNITPYLGGGIVGNFGIPPEAKNVHDQLHARALVLDDGTTKLAFVVSDNISIAREVYDEAKRIIHKRTGIPPEHVLTSSTHTHSATSAQGDGALRRAWNFGKPLDEYQQFVAHRIADGVAIALEHLGPARIGWGAVNVPEHVFNRRWKMKKPVINPFGGMDAVKMNPGIGNPDLVEPAGPTDPEVSFISVQAVDGRPIALLANYSLHYVGGVPKHDISADYFAVFADRIQELLHADRQEVPFVGIMSNGTSGDINNINVKGPKPKDPPYAKMHFVADDVAKEVFQAYESVNHVPWVKLGAAQTILPLQVRKPDAETLKLANQILSRPENSKPLHHSLEREYAVRVVDHAAGWPDQIDVILQVFQIGDLGIAAIPFETFAETGLEIKSRSPMKKTFTISLANGSYGYLPTPEQHEVGGYETWLTTNKVEKNASRKIVETLLNMFGESE